MAGAEIFDKAEIQAVTDVIERKMIHRYGSHGERKGIYRTEEFERKAAELAGTKRALAVTNGTAALIVALKGIGIQPGDEIITTPFSFERFWQAIQSSSISYAAFPSIIKRIPTVFTSHLLYYMLFQNRL